MKNFLKNILILSVIAAVSPAISFAAQLEDVKVLSVSPGKDNVELKLQVKDGPADSYFFLDIVKTDPDAFEKINHILKKMKNKDVYKINLVIPSFSVLPSGSYYRSEGIIFSNPAEREPNAINTPKKKK